MNILLGYEIKTGKSVKIKPSHLIVTGVTQLSGKTTTLESLIKRSGLKAIVFKTKIGERSFIEGTETPPFFRDRSDYDFVRSLIEAYSREKLMIEKGTLMKLCKGSQSLLEIKKRVDEIIAEGKLRGIKEEIYTRLQHYLENLIPQIQYSNLSRILHIYDGLNIMNLERFSPEAQSLIIQSVAEEVLNTMRDVILVIPEAWKFLPQKYNNPCKRSVETFIRQGAANHNYVWIDSQDMSGVDKIPLKQISTWILGYQTERNEVKHTLDQIAMPAKNKPKVNAIMNLKKGHFIVSSYDGVQTVYVLPYWLDESTAQEIAKGKKSVDDLHHQPSLTPISMPNVIDTNTTLENPKTTAQQARELVELRMDFFNKIKELQQNILKLSQEINAIKLNLPSGDTDHIVSMVLQKMPMPSMNAPLSDSPEINEQLINEIIRRLPQGQTVTYQVAPLEKIKKDFLKETKEKLCEVIRTLDEKQKKMLKWIEQNGKRALKKELFMNCFGKSATSGPTYQALVGKITQMKQVEIIRVDTQNRIFPFLKQRIMNLLSQYGANGQEIEQIYNHVLAEIIQ